MKNDIVTQGTSSISEFVLTSLQRLKTKLLYKYQSLHSFDKYSCIICMFKKFTPGEKFPVPLAHCAYWQGLSDRSSQPALSLLSSPDLSRHGTSEHAPPHVRPKHAQQRGGAPARKAQCARARTRLSIEGPFPTENFPTVLLYTPDHPWPSPTGASSHSL